MTKYIIDTEKPHQVHSVHNNTVDYTGYLYNNNKGNLTISEYLARGYCPNAKIMTFDYYYENYLLPYQESLKWKFSEISEDEYHEMLNCLPPLKWHNFNDLNIFFISEAFTADIHSMYVIYKGKYYTCNASIYETDIRIENELLKHLGII